MSETERSETHALPRFLQEAFWKVDPKLRGIKRHVYAVWGGELDDGDIVAVIEVGPIDDSGSLRDAFAQKLADVLNEAKL